MDDSKWNETVTKMVRDHMISLEKFTENQLAEVIIQAIKSGDLVKYVQHTGLDHRQAVVYIPFQGQDRLKSRIRVLEAALEKIAETNICNTCGAELVAREALGRE